jgi:hypothetical protein
VLCVFGFIFFSLFGYWLHKTWVKIGSLDYFIRKELARSLALLPCEGGRLQIFSIFFNGCSYYIHGGKIMKRVHYIVYIVVLVLILGSTFSAGTATTDATYYIYLPLISHDPMRTEVITFYPTGLSGTYKSGYCWSNSMWLLRRDAWRCQDPNYGITDPCISPIGVTNYVVCGAHPLNNPIGYRLYLTSPLPEPAPPHPDEDAYAWAMELFEGVTCSLVQASSWPHCLPRYYCSDDLAMTDYPNPGQLWTAERGFFSIETCSLSQIEISDLKTVWR